MRSKTVLRNAGFLLLAGPLLVLTMGQGCPAPIPGGGTPRFVELVLVNDSADFIQPLVYADPRILSLESEIMIPANRISIGAPLAPGEVVTITLACVDAGSILVDADEIQLPDGSLRPPRILQLNRHYFCGETVTFYYDPVVLPAPVTVELWNVTSNLVDAFFWSDPGTVLIPEWVAIDPNFVDVGGELFPGDLVTVTLECADAGTFLADGDLLLEPAGSIAAQNPILLNEGAHFFCGDLVSFYYEVDGVGGFFISADVNDINIAP